MASELKELNERLKRLENAQIDNARMLQALCNAFCPTPAEGSRAAKKQDHETRKANYKLKLIRRKAR